MDLKDRLNGDYWMFDKHCNEKENNSEWHRECCRNLSERHATKMGRCQALVPGTFPSRSKALSAEGRTNDRDAFSFGSFSMGEQRKWINLLLVTYVLDTYTCRIGRTFSERTTKRW